MKKRTWYLTLLTIITVICIAIGLLVHVVLPAGNWLSVHLINNSRIIQARPGKIFIL